MSQGLTLTHCTSVAACQVLVAMTVARATGLPTVARRHVMTREDNAAFARAPRETAGTSSKAGVAHRSRGTGPEARRRRRRRSPRAFRPGRHGPREFAACRAPRERGHVG